MSYSREYGETVTGNIYKTVYVDYPASENGGSVSYTIDEDVDIPVSINIHVDTDPFDNSIERCNDNVNLLTAAVVATEAAEIISIERNSKKVADTIIGGFFSYIRSEISQQIAELKQNIDAQLMHIKELAQSCLAKKTQMETDYNRISGRYIKIFEDLNNELSNRIFEMDRSAFSFKKETDNQHIRVFGNDLVNTVTIFGAESGGLQSKISVSISKKRAFDTLNKARIFLLQQKNLDSTIQQSMLNENISNTIFTPVCFFEKNNKNTVNDQKIFAPNFLSGLKEKKQDKELTEKFSSNTIQWKRISADQLKNLKLYFDIELNKKNSANDHHSVRVREMIQSIARLGEINVIN